MINNPKKLENEYNIKELLGEGGFGKVYKVQKKSTLKYYALKIESIDSDVKLLKNEISIYRYLSNIDKISNLYWYGVNSGIRYGIFDLYDKDLKNIDISKEYLNNTFIQMLRIIKDIHDKKIIHRDLKPENFMLKDKSIYLIDFGLSKSYIHNKEHIKINMKNDITGNILFCSPYVQEKLEPSRRDDLISLGYCFIYLVKKDLPWNETIIKKKLSFTSEKIYKYTKHKALFYYFQYCLSLKFKDSPDYDKLINLFNLYPITT